MIGWTNVSVKPMKFEFSGKEEDGYKHRGYVSNCQTKVFGTDLETKLGFVLHVSPIRTKMYLEVLAKGTGEDELYHPLPDGMLGEIMRSGVSIRDEQAGYANVDGVEMLWCKVGVGGRPNIGLLQHLDIGFNWDLYEIFSAIVLSLNIPKVKTLPDYRRFRELMEKVERFKDEMTIDTFWGGSIKEQILKKQIRIETERGIIENCEVGMNDVQRRINDSIEVMNQFGIPFEHNWVENEEERLKIWTAN